MSTADISTILQRVVHAAQRLTAADAVALLLNQRNLEPLTIAYPAVAMGLDEGWQGQHGLEGAQALAGRVEGTHDIIEVLDTATISDIGLPLLAGGQRPGAVCLLPLLAEDSTVGVLALYSVAPRTFGHDREVLQAIAALATSSLANLWAHERERALRIRLEALNDATKVVSAELSLERVLQQIVEIAVSIAGARYGALGIAGSDGYLTDFITTGISPEERTQIGPLPRGHGLLGVLIRNGQALRIPSIASDPRRVGFPPHHPPMAGLLGVPIRVRDRVVGDLYLTDKIDVPEFSAEDQYMIELLAAHAGVAIENARLYQDLHEANRARGALISVISHDLRGPLTVIRGSAQLAHALAEHHGSPDTLLFGRLSSIVTAATKMDALISDLVDVARLQLGMELTLSHQPTDLVGLARQVAEQLQTNQCPTRVQTTVPELIGEWDPAQLERVLVNLVSNAIKFSPDGGEITLQIGREEHERSPWAVVIVQDHGLGISETDLPHIFEQYYRAGNVVGRITGTGIGLTSVQQIVARHGGTIDVVSSEGIGATFTIRLPLVPPKMQTPG